MSAAPIFEHEVDFDPANAAEVLRSIPSASGIVSLFGHSTTDKPYLMQSANLRRRLQRLLMPAEGQTKRLNLRDRIARIAWRETHSELESLLLLHRAMSVVFGVDEARRRMRLSPPFTIRYAVENRFPRIYVTNHLRRRSLHTTFGPFASRLDADRYREAVEDLFVIRRCFLELHPSPDDPGCIYGEMHKCMAPCQARCTDRQYLHEAERTLAFLKTGGMSLQQELETERDKASTDMLFEEAAALHERVNKARAAAKIADDLIQPLDSLHAALLLPGPGSEEPQVQVFVFAAGRLRGPAIVSLLGVRLAKEQEQVGTLLFAQPMMLAPVPLEPTGSAATEASAEERLLAAISKLEDEAGTQDTATLADHLAMLRRWYYRPEKQRSGVLFQREKDAWPVRRMVRAGAKLLQPKPTTDTTPATGIPASDQV